ncbi:hypothetical protein A5634_04110 [Mycobacterium asiaticum]|uniref:Lipoprotein LppJ n=1 Tax=Mycobacterium asiaticum TaxID=1790 RepID=A0A1A3NV21_MYCAS|nr:hypothetical protein A5634_04110 [Mycobacterium asiaticum]
MAVDQLHSTAADAVNPSGPTVSDEQSKAQAVGSARLLAGDARLHTTTAGYMLMSCRDRDNPPYQGAVYLTFAVPPGTRADAYLPEVTRTLTSAGWVEGLQPGGHAYSKSLTKGAVTAIIYRHDDDPNLGVLRLYGECRNMNDHRNDATAWVDITNLFTP